jgi:CheY-like chemotaxis protein
MNLPLSTILLVEDNPHDVLLLRRAIRHANLACSLEVAPDGEIALDYLSGQGKYADRDRYPLPALILLDLKLPRKSGHEVLAWLRLQPGLGRLPVVIFTGSHETSDVSRAYDLHVNSYLVKPVTPRALVQLVQRLGEYWLLHNERPQI